mgnify:CR=1 FL=1
MKTNFIYKSQKLIEYVTSIKSIKKVDIYSICNTTLVINPSDTDFPKNFILGTKPQSNKLILFLFRSIKYYLFNFIRCILYVQTLIYYRLLYKKPELVISKKDLFLDIFFLVDQIIKDDEFNDKYFISLYPVLTKKSIRCIFIPRMYGLNNNPIKLHFQLINFFRIMNKSNSFFLFEFELLSFKDIIEIFLYYLSYPFKTLRLLIKEKDRDDVIYNHSLIMDISNFGLDSFTRYIFGKNIAKIKNISRIYSWSEFHALERTFNYAIREIGKIKIYACQFFINYHNYFSTYIHKIDNINNCAPHVVLLNGKNGFQGEEGVEYRPGVALRYSKLFSYEKTFTGNKIVIMGSYSVSTTNNLLKLTNQISPVYLKNHPAVPLSSLNKSLINGIKILNNDIYEIFSDTKIVVGTFSGALLEAVACGISVIIIKTDGELLMNPLTDFGKGKIWNMASNEEDLTKCFNSLIRFREENITVIDLISNWYRDKFFIEPTEINILKAFELC